MRATYRPKLSLAMLCVGAILLAEATSAATPPSTDQPTVKELQNQTDALAQELAQLKSASDPATQQQVMQHHWSMMQDHMRTMGMMPGMGARGCTDWMMMDSTFMGSTTTGQGGRMGCGWMGHGWMGQGMTNWGMPSSMTPNEYQRQMQDRMQQMQKQMAAIAAERDPAKRQALMREHYQTMYRDMQTMRGMGWMWAPNAAASLPEAKSQGAQLVAKYCSQCHATPSPTLHTQQEWSQVTARMREHINDQASGPGAGVKIPSTSELDTITEYLGKHGSGVR